MSAPRPIVVGLGDLLWDLFPSGKQLGGAPANFAYITALLGDSGIVASRVGDDRLGQEALWHFKSCGLDVSRVQRDLSHPTGTVKVEVDSKGQPEYQITENVAWDFLEFSEDWISLARSAHAVCFGTLAQRNSVSRSTIRAFLSALPAFAIGIFDVNLRQSFFRPKIFRTPRRSPHPRRSPRHPPLGSPLCFVCRALSPWSPWLNLSGPRQRVCRRNPIPEIQLPSSGGIQLGPWVPKARSGSDKV